MFNAILTYIVVCRIILILQSFQIYINKVSMSATNLKICGSGTNNTTALGRGQFH